MFLIRLNGYAKQYWKIPLFNDGKNKFKEIKKKRKCFVVAIYIPIKDDVVR